MSPTPKIGSRKIPRITALMIMRLTLNELGKVIAEQEARQVRTR